MFVFKLIPIDISLTFCYEFIAMILFHFPTDLHEVFSLKYVFTDL